MENPFVQLAERLTRLESLMLEMKGALSYTPPETRRVPLDIERVSLLTNLAKPTIYGLVSNRQIPFSKQGKKLYFFEDEILDWIQQGRRKTRAEIEAEATAHLERLRTKKA